MPEVWGASPPIELLRQLIDAKGFYDREENDFINVVDNMLLICAAPPVGGRNKLTMRF